MPITIRPGELTDILLMAAIRAQEWGTESFWTDRISQSWFYFFASVPILASRRNRADSSGGVGLM